MDVCVKDHIEEIAFQLNFYKVFESHITANTDVHGYFYRACRDKKMDMAKMLIRHVDLNIALKSACHTKSRKVVLLLLTNGADIKYCNYRLSIIDLEWLLIKSRTENNLSYLNNKYIPNSERFRKTNKRMFYAKLYLNVLLSKELSNGILEY